MLDHVPWTVHAPGNHTATSPGWLQRPRTVQDGLPERSWPCRSAGGGRHFERGRRGGGCRPRGIWAPRVSGNGLVCIGMPHELSRIPPSSKVLGRHGQPPRGWAVPICQGEGSTADSEGVGVGSDDYGQAATTETTKSLLLSFCALPWPSCSFLLDSLCPRLLLTCSHITF